MAVCLQETARTGRFRSPERFLGPGSGHRNFARAARWGRLWLVACISAAALCVSAQESPEPDIRALIGQLGAPRHKDRENAFALLWQTGEPALDLLREAAQADDPEISARAGELAENIRLGIPPAWPEALREQVRKFEATPLESHPGFMTSLATSRGGEAVPFLLSRLRVDPHPDNATALKLLQDLAEDPGARERIQRRIRPPANQNEARLLAHLMKAGGSFADQLALLEIKHLPESDRGPVVEAVMKTLRAQWASGDMAALGRDAGLAARACPGEARLLYLQGLAVAGRPDGKARAEGLFDQALALHPDKEAPHYSAGTLLNDLGQPRLAEREWRRILEIPPADEVYDINAHLRIGDILKGRGEHAAAADAFEKALALYRAAREKPGGGGYGLLGNEKELEKIIAALRATTRTELKLSLRVTVKGDRREAMEHMLKGADVTLSLNVQPAGLRLFEVAPATVGYDAGRKEYVVLLNGSRCGEGVPGVLKEGRNRVAVKTLDMVYLFEIASDTGKAEKIESYEKDYLVRIKVGEDLHAWKEIVLRVNGKAQTLRELEDGLFFDILPGKLELEAEGVAPDGQGRKLKKEIPLRDPD